MNTRVRPFASRLKSLGAVTALLCLSLAPTTVEGQATKTETETKKASGPAPGTPALARSYKVSKGDIVRTILVTGELRSQRSVDITVPNTRSGFANNITYLATEGAPIKTGERLVEFDSSNLLNQKAEAERNLEEKRLTIEKTKATLEASRADLLADVATAQGNLKVAQLYAKIGKELLPANTYQKYQLDLAKAQLALQKAQEKLDNLDATTAAQMALVELDRAQAEIDLKKIDSDIALLSIDAPLDGIVIYGDNWLNNRKFQVGDQAFPMQPVVTLPDLSSMQIVGFVYDTELPFLSVGMTCEFHIDSIPGKTWTGKLASLTSVANRKGFASQHKVFRAVVLPDKVEDELWKPGMTARVEVPVSVGSNVVSIPRDFLGLRVDGRYFVRKGVDPKTAADQLVEVGGFNDKVVEITSGLSEGDVVLDTKHSAEVAK
jgi:HlyD family secretion protein